ncbi:hypothetical protein E6C76_04945 [Pseudothauera nasutitermitis]|uniref:Uncharacterized protein n=1 Tax=Pseudothauera nasutitermitis TaxID=2565930 RepID=A0A4V3WC88_9RHOO|nr:hypothetical protein [Pseudothauera nasutitermitis]THF66208.1 hypothetical protein E6C76_04945 [Pseudothauera nasutitermitis]
MTAIFAKTRKGQEEIEHRSGLGPRARRVLILFDGKRRLAEVRALMPDPALDDTLALLQAEGYLEATGAAAAETASTQRTEGRTIEPARNFMMNSLRTFNGPYGNIDLMTRISDSRSALELQGLVDDWLESISLTRAGRQRAAELKGQLLTVL